MNFMTFHYKFTSQVPEIREKILKENDGKWAKIAKKQSNTYFNPKKVDMRAQARR